MYYQDNFVDQPDPYYFDLRNQANEAGNAMAKYFKEGHRAYARGDGALAKELSNMGRQCQSLMDDLNAEASEWVFLNNNRNCAPNQVNLHDLYVKEAIAYTDRALQEALARGDEELHLIVGRGSHSRNGAARLRPAIAELMERYQLSAQLDPSNAGVLVVQLNSTSNLGFRAGELASRL